LGAASGGQLITTSEGISAAPKQPVLFAAVQYVVEDDLARGVTTQRRDLQRGSPTPKPAAENSVQHEKFDLSKRVVASH